MYLLNVNKPDTDNILALAMQFLLIMQLNFKLPSLINIGNKIPSERTNN